MQTIHFAVGCFPNAPSVLGGATGRAEQADAALILFPVLTLPMDAASLVISDVTQGRRRAAEPRQVLIVDDNLALAENIAEILQIDGHITRVAPNAEEGARMVYENPPDVIVTDFRLPGLNGAEFLERLRGSRMQVYAIVISGHTDERTLKEANDAGASFMAKPLNFALLSHWVRQGSASV